MKKKLMTAIMTMVMALAMCFSAFADDDVIGWKNYEYGRVFYGPDHQTYKNGWYWIPVDYNGTAYCYYFDENGNLLNDYAGDSVTPDGKIINSYGAWTVDGIVQTTLVNLADYGYEELPESTQGLSNSALAGDYYRYSDNWERTAYDPFIRVAVIDENTLMIQEKASADGYYLSLDPTFITLKKISDNVYQDPNTTRPSTFTYTFKDDGTLVYDNWGVDFTYEKRD